MPGWRIPGAGRRAPRWPLRGSRARSSAPPWSPICAACRPSRHRSRAAGRAAPISRGRRQPASRPMHGRWLEAAEAAADVAGCVIRPFFRASLDASDKADASPVTIADRTAEQAMRAVLSERLPEHGILGEEFGLERPDARMRWVLAPVDGTRAFITGRPSFGILVALLQDGAPGMGVIDQ